MEVDLNSNGFTKVDNTITINETVGINNNFKKDYKVRLSLKNSASTYSYEDALTINYAATQNN